MGSIAKSVTLGGVMVVLVGGLAYMFGAGFITIGTGGGSGLGSGNNSKVADNQTVIDTSGLITVTETEYCLASNCFKHTQLDAVRAALLELEAPGGIQVEVRPEAPQFQVDRLLNLFRELNLPRPEVSVLRE
ncbi:MAG: hypothetical protein RLY93_12010 [Sumerlaeia bacterium]